MEQPNEICFGGIAAPVPAKDEVSNTSSSNVVISGDKITVTVEDPTHKLQWWEILEKAFVQLTTTEENRELYGDPNRGATLEQAWRAQFLVTGMFQVCLMASGRSAVPTAAIRRTVMFTPSDLVQTLARAFTLDSRFACMTFVFDSHMGHCITLLGHDPSTSSFVYHDPWPVRSLLCRENNAADVAAEPAEGGAWRITASELVTIIFATFIWPTTWADLTGVSYKITYSQLKNSDFWAFFNLHEVSRDKEPMDYDWIDRTIVFLETGGFPEEIKLQVQLDASERIRQAVLALHRPWMIGKPWGINPFALDIAKSFLDALTPNQDRGDVEPLIEGIRNLPHILRDHQAVPRAVEQLLLTYLGLQSESTTNMTFSRLIAANVDWEGETWLRLTLELY